MRLMTLLLGVLLLGPAAQAYQVKAGDQLLQLGAGGSFNYIRQQQVTRETPPSLALLGLVYDYALTDSLAVTGALRPGLANAYLDLPVAAGMRYRFTGLDAPLVPYALGELVVDLGLPLGPPPPHLNTNLRGAIGLEYFVMGHFGVALELAFEGGPLLTPEFALESSSEILLSCGYRL